MLTVVFLMGGDEFWVYYSNGVNRFSQELEYGICEQEKLRRTLWLVSSANSIVDFTEIGEVKSSKVCWAVLVVYRNSKY